MAEYEPTEDGDAQTDLIYLKPTKYAIGGEEATPHVHLFYLRDDLPLATCTRKFAGRFHAHSIVEGPDGTLICQEADGHTHTQLVVEEPGDYAIRTLFTE